MYFQKLFSCLFVSLLSRLNHLHAHNALPSPKPHSTSSHLSPDHHTKHTFCGQWCDLMECCLLGNKWWQSWCSAGMVVSWISWGWLRLELWRRVATCSKGGCLLLIVWSKVSVLLSEGWIGHWGWFFSAHNGPSVTFHSFSYDHLKALGLMGNSGVYFHKLSLPQMEQGNWYEACVPV